MGEQTVEHVVGVPAPRLRPYVASYVGYRYEGFRPGVHAGLPSHALTLVISLDAPLDVGGLGDPDRPRQRCDSLLAGLHTRPAAVHHDGSQYGVQLDITPLGARALFGMPAAELAEQNVPLGTLPGWTARTLAERLRETPTWAGRFEVLDTVLGRAVSEIDDPPPEVVFAWRRLTGAEDAVEVRRLAAEVGWSRRHLSERFRGEFGLSPKILARVVRFERARRLLIRSDRPRLSDVAAMSGYADQAHLSREWNEFAGSSPSAWLAAEQLPFVQDEACTADQNRAHE